MTENTSVTVNDPDDARILITPDDEPAGDTEPATEPTPEPQPEPEPDDEPDTEGSDTGAHRA